MKSSALILALLLASTAAATAAERSQGRSVPNEKPAAARPAPAAEPPAEAQPEPPAEAAPDAAEAPAVDPASLPAAEPAPPPPAGSWGTRAGAPGATAANDAAAPPPDAPAPAPAPAPADAPAVPPASIPAAEAAGPAQLVKPLAQPQSRSYDLYSLTTWNRTAVTLTVNGIDVLTYGDGLPERGQRGDFLTPWLVRGENVIKVTMQPADTGIVPVEKSASLVLRAAPDGQNLKSFSASDTITLKQEEVPQWSWQDAETWNGDFAEVLAAVQELHLALANHDIAAVNAMHQARYDDFAKIYGTPNGNDVATADERLRQASPLPLDQLLVRRHAEGRLVHVTDRAGKGPITVRFADGGTQRTGEWWSKIKGEWQVVR